MEYFFSHILYIVIAAVVIAFVAFAAVVMGAKNEAERSADEERCDFSCGSCPSAALCHKSEKRDEI